MLLAYRYGLYSTVVFASNPALCGREDVMRSLSRAFDRAAYIVPATTSYRSKTAGLEKLYLRLQVADEAHMIL